MNPRKMMNKMFMSSPMSYHPSLMLLLLLMKMLLKNLMIITRMKMIMKYWRQILTNGLFMTKRTVTSNKYAALQS